MRDTGELTAFPGGDLVATGLADLSRRVASAEAFLVSMGAPRLRRAGLAVPFAFDDPERRLYDLLATEGADAAHGRYNSLVRRLVSFEHALECAS
jgi:hypothetical protein